MDYHDLVQNLGSDIEATRNAAIDRFETIMQTGGEAVSLVLFLQELDSLPEDMACNSVIFALVDHAWRGRRAKWAPMTAKILWKLQLAAYSNETDQGNSVLARAMRDAINSGNRAVIEDLRSETPRGHETTYSLCFQAASS